MRSAEVGPTDCRPDWCQPDENLRWTGPELPAIFRRDNRGNLLETVGHRGSFGIRLGRSAVVRIPVIATS